jgi:AraC-like DNA-binding protein
MAQMVRRLLEMHGLDAVGISRAAGLDLAAVAGPAERIDIDRFDAIMRVAIPLIGNPAFGLQAARCWHPANLGVLGHAWLSSSTLRTGLARLARYNRIVSERGLVEVEDTGRDLTLRFWARRGNPAVDNLAAVIVDIAMSLLLDMCRMNAGAALRPVAVHLRRHAPEDASTYEYFFGCAVQFSADENSFTLAHADVDRVLPSSNKQLAAVFDRMLSEELGRLDKSDVVSRCRAGVLEHLGSGELSANDMAKALNMSPRTLQRKLAEANTTYLKLVDDTRRDLGLRYVADPRYSITEITFMLGFAQQSGFTRAFRRWTGSSPSAYREQVTGQTAS